MALTMQGALQSGQLKDNMDSIANDLTQSTDTLSTINTDEEFNKFVEGTNFGGSVMHEWTTMLNLIGDNLSEQIKNLTAATQEYIETQEKLNNTNI